MSKIEDFLKRSPIYPALILEGYFSGRKRLLVINITKYVIFTLPVIIVLTIIFADYGIQNSNIWADLIVRKLIGVGILAISLYLIMHLFEAYFASVYYFEYIAHNRYLNKEYYTFSAGRILRRVTKDNLLTGLLRSEGVGKRIIKRLGISDVEAKKLLEEQKNVVEPKIIELSEKKVLKVFDVVSFIYKNYPDFKKLLDSHGLNENDLKETVDWVIYQVEAEAYNRQWWKPEKLARVPGVASDWSFGRTYLLSRYSRNVGDDQEVNSDAISFEGRTRELAQLQSILSRASGANAILVGEPGQEKMEVVWNLTRQIKNKTTLPQIVGKKILLFLTTSFTADMENKDDFEDKLETILKEALQAGNIVLVIDNLAKLLIQARQFEVNLTEIFEPYLAGIGGQMIALIDTEYFQTLVEGDKSFMSHFEVVRTKPLILSEIVDIIERQAIVAEKIYEIAYTYPAILEIAKSADYYFPDGVSSDKASDLLAELSPWAVEKGLETVDKNQVLQYVSEKTNIPIAAITEPEKEKLLNLEGLLMKKVIAQREAVFSVASAIRRSRAGIRNQNRPIGSFLFLGPTGVGKTETAKALASVFFNDEKNLLRLDMSEYQSEESLERLIGSIMNKNQGILSNLLREHPYGVLLLDEFEKTNKKVLNLFLQIIDEGYFTDAFGKKVIARNIIFIATSNAGADKIFEIITSGDNLKDNEDKIISHIVKDGIFRPELINRFDATVLFHPLSKNDLLEIAKLMLKKVAGRLAEKGINLITDNNLIAFVVENGYNPTFGARPMNRLIQDTIEEHLSDLIIRGELIGGKNISFEVLSNDGQKNSLKPIIS